MPGVDYVKQRGFSIPLRLPIQTGCRRRAHTRREWLRFNLHTQEIVSKCNLKRATRTPFNLLDLSLLSTVTVDCHQLLLAKCNRDFYTELKQYRQTGLNVTTPIIDLQYSMLYIYSNTHNGNRIYVRPVIWNNEHLA